MRHLCSMFVSFVFMLSFLSTASAQVAATLHYESNDTLILRDSKGYFYLKTSDSTVGVAAGGAYSGDVNIPSHIAYKGVSYRVSTVRRGAMWKKAGASNIGVITSVTLPETVTLVGSDAFRGNTSLKEVRYGKDTRIEVRSFWGCPALKLEKHCPLFGYTEPFSDDEYKGKEAYQFYTRLYYPIDEPNDTLKNYTWAFLKHRHSGIRFDKWYNMDNESSMGCYSFRIEKVRGALYTLRDPDNVESMFRGYLTSDVSVLLADNSYVGTHEFPAFNRRTWSENPINMPQSFVASMEKKYGRKVMTCTEAASIAAKDGERFVHTEFKITNREAMYVLSWVKDGREICSFVERKKLESDELFSVWNVDDDGTYGEPNVISIARDERGNIELFLQHSAPESINYIHLVQKGNKLVEEYSEYLYVWID